MTVNISHQKLEAIFFRFNIGIRFRIKFNENSPTPLNIVRVLKSEGAPLERGVVALEKGDQLILSERIKTGWKEKSAELVLRNLSLGPSPERFHRRISPPPSFESPFCTSFRWWNPYRL